MKNLIHATAAIILLIMSAPVFAGEDLKSTIQAREDAWSSAFNAGDTAAVTAFYEEDAVLLAPGGPPVHGNTAIGERLSGLFGVLQNIKLNTDEVRPAGENYAVEFGHVEYDQADADGAIFSITGNYVVNWHKGEDGIWRYVSDIFNERHREPKSE